jgi:hypothetical protein
MMKRILCYGDSNTWGHDPVTRERKSQQFSEHYGRVARELGCAYLDTSAVIVSSPLDGILFDISQLHAGSC